MKPDSFLSKLFMGSSFFTIALREKTPHGIIADLPFRADWIMPATKAHWAADPMLVEDGTRTWLFYEEVTDKKGRIAVAEVLDGCRLSRPTTILEDWCHYSYPFVFFADGIWYMIPESSAAREIRLYRAIDFPYQWELQKVLLRDKAVDTTVFRSGNTWWLLTFLSDSTSEHVFPRAYSLSGWEDPVLKEESWPEYDTLRVRGAGPVFLCDGNLIRPAQICQEQRYGDGIVLYSLDLTDSYNETPGLEIAEKDIRIRGYYTDGLHTYCASNKYEAIDVRCRAVDPLKVIRRIIQK